MILGKLRDDQPSNKRIFFWNTTGSICSSCTSFLLLLLVTRICGADEAGNYSIGYAIAQLMWTVGVFEATTYTATDTGYRFSDEQYLAFKILSLMAMVVSSVIYVWSFHYDIHKGTLALVLCLYRFFDALSLYYFGVLQRQGRLDISGFTIAWQTILSLVAFSLVLLMTHDAVMAVLIASVAEIIWIAAYVIPRWHHIKITGHPDFTPSVMAHLFIELLPLFLGTFLANYLYNIPKYAIDGVGTAKMQTVFNVLFMPTFVINLFLLFIIRPALTPMAENWSAGRRKEFFGTVRKLLLAVVGITIVIIVLGVTIGIPLLEFFYGIDLTGYKITFIIILIGGGFASASSVIYDALVIIRKQSLVLVAYGLAVLSGILVATPLVAFAGIDGAGLVYVISCVVLLIMFIVMFLLGIRTGRPNSRGDHE